MQVRESIEELYSLNINTGQVPKDLWLSMMNVSVPEMLKTLALHRFENRRGKVKGTKAQWEIARKAYRDLNDYGTYLGHPDDRSI